MTLTDESTIRTLALLEELTGEVKRLTEQVAIHDELLQELTHGYGIICGLHYMTAKPGEKSIPDMVKDGEL